MILGIQCSMSWEKKKKTKTNLLILAFPVMQQLSWTALEASCHCEVQLLSQRVTWRYQVQDAGESSDCDAVSSSLSCRAFSPGCQHQVPS